MANDGQKDQIRDNAPTGSGRPIDLDIEGNDRNTETRDQSHGVKGAGQEGVAPKQQIESDTTTKMTSRYGRIDTCGGTKTLPKGMQRQGA
ncbi:hypothetical protein HYC85_030169 [Camellia sinensis]|uniref:Uncharacterized protein n=1 Tax=Camellia sinensis TaxID=4442 RepID=A0A7J7G2V1_CAMSI|nr:hypothetical protein HYC85_030169 [Camellia sinensis]